MLSTSKVFAVSLLLLASGCAASKRAKEAAAVAAAQAAAQAQQAADIAKAPTPEQKLGVLVTAYPELVSKPTRVIHKTDTLFIKEAQAQAVLPAVSSAATDTALIQSLLDKLEAAGHLVTKAQVNALQRGLLPELAQRPRLSRDTARTQQNGLEITAWVDKAGSVQIVSRKLQQQLPYPSIIWDVAPQPVVLQQLTTLQKLGIMLKAYYWLLLLIILITIFLIVKNSRK